MNFRRAFVAALGGTLATVGSIVVLAQSPSPTPGASPTPAPSPSPGVVPVEITSASPTPSDVATPTPSPAPYASPTPITATLSSATPTPEPIESSPASDQPPPLVTSTPDVFAPDELGLPADFGDPGEPPPAVPEIQRNIQDVAPSAETVRKMNEEAVAKITAFTLSQRNPNVRDLTIDEAIAIALHQNPDILNAIQQIRLTQGQVVEVTSQALPQLTVTSAYQVQAETLTDPKRPNTGDGGSLTIPGPDGENIEVDFSGGGGGPYVNPKSWDIQFQASQLLYSGGGVIAGIRSAQYVENSAYFQLRQIINETIASVKIAFYQVILNRALVVAQQQSVNLLKEQLVDQQNRYEAGTVPRFNVLQAEVALANAEPPLIQAQNALRISQYNLVVVLGMDYSKAKPSEVPFNVVGRLPYRPRAINPDESIRVAIERSPLLKAQRQTILAQAQNVKVAFSGYLPVIQAAGGYVFENNNAFQNLGEVTQGWTAGIQGSWAIFDGFETAGQTAQARAQLQQAAITYDDSVRQVILNVQEAISNLQTAQQTLESQQATVVQATEALRLSQERLDAGAGTQLDVLNQQTSLLQAQTTVLQARYDYLQALAQYDLALSLDAQYAQLFEDPLSKPEREKFKVVTDPIAPQPPLPGELAEQDPIVGLAANAPPAPIVKGKQKVVRVEKAVVVPQPTPKKKKGFLWFGRGDD